MKLAADTIKKIVVFRALQLGDLLCAVPAFRALRQAYPDAEIVLAGLPWAASFVERFRHYLDRFIHFPGYPGLPEQVPDRVALIAFLENMQQEKFDLALQMQGSGSIVNPLVQMFGAAYTAGFYEKKDPSLPEDFFLRYPDNIPETGRHLALMQHLGIPPQGTFLEFPLGQKDQEDFDLLHLPVANREYVCIHPGSRASWRQWHPKYFAALADYCSSRGFMPVITGTEDETFIAKEVLKYMKHEAINLAGHTSLGAVGVLIKNAYALICNCTGVSHIAAALKTPSIVISHDGEPYRWAPENETLHYVIDWKNNPHFDQVFTRTVALMEKEGNACTAS